MASIFLFSLILGGGLLGLSLLGDLFGGGDVDLDGDLDADFDGSEVGSDASAPGEVPTDVAGAIRIFTIRNLTYFLFGFGGIGWLLMSFGPELPIWAITATAVLGGSGAAGAAAVLFGWLKATDETAE